MKIVIPGSSGQIGGVLARAFHQAGHEVVVLGRNPASARSRELILRSRRVVPGRLLESDFVFHFPEWADAARDLCRRHRDGS